MRLLLICVLALVASLGESASAADVPIVVSDAWMRATVPAQQSATVFMRITASADTTLTGAATPVAKLAELHSMTQEAGVMKMRPLERLPIRAGTTVALTPEGTHLMLTGLAHQIREGDVVPISLSFVDAQGRASRVDVAVKAGAVTAMGRAGKDP